MVLEWYLVYDPCHLGAAHRYGTRFLWDTKQVFSILHSKGMCLGALIKDPSSLTIHTHRLTMTYNLRYHFR